MRIGPAPIGQNAPTPAAKPPAPQPARSFATVLDEGSALGPEVPAVAAPKPTAVPLGPARSATPGPVRAMLERAVGAERRVDALLEAAARGKTFTPAQLLAMQATVARYSQTVEVVSRVADRLVGAIKQTMGTQV
ncbi:MAG TPA: hypothetical protein VN853_19055 [Polyangia bacterium]|jgi:hypothetical protein|nr:hypothetical protein [Polyangia bacterium]